MNKLAISLVSLVVGLGMVMPEAAIAQSKVYWALTIGSKIQRANRSGGIAEDLVTGLDSPHGIAVDHPAGKMYWTDLNTDRIQRANLDGTDIEDLITTGLDDPHAIALDPFTGKMYWTDIGTGYIHRADLDGSNIEDVVTTSVAEWITLDPAGGKIYWTDHGTPHKIKRANLDGSDIEDLITTGVGSPQGIGLDVEGGKLYWADRSLDRIVRANLDGSDVEEIVTKLDLALMDRPEGLAIETVGSGKVYWTQAGSPYNLYRANLDGSDIDLLVVGLLGPQGIAIGSKGPPGVLPALGRTGTVLLCAALFATAAIFRRSRRQPVA